MTMIDAECASRFAIAIRRFGMSSDEAVAVLAAIARVPLPPHLEAMLATAARAVRPGWWMSSEGWAARWRFGRWRKAARRISRSS